MIQWKEYIYQFRSFQKQVMIKKKRHCFTWFYTHAECHRLKVCLPVSRFLPSYLQTDVCLKLLIRYLQLTNIGLIPKRRRAGTNSLWAAQEIFRLLWKLKINYLFPDSLLLACVKCQMNPVHIFLLQQLIVAQMFNKIPRLLWNLKGNYLSCKCLPLNYVINLTNTCTSTFRIVLHQTGFLCFTKYARNTVGSKPHLGSKRVIQMNFHGNKCIQVSTK
jgi:hypothetical protein